MLAILLQTGAVIGAAHHTVVKGFWESRDSAWWSAVAAIVSLFTAYVSARSSIRSAKAAETANLHATRASMILEIDTESRNTGKAVQLEVTNAGPGVAHKVSLHHQIGDQTVWAGAFVPVSDPLQYVFDSSVKGPLPAGQSRSIEAKLGDNSDRYGTHVLEWSDSIGNLEQIHFILFAVESGRVALYVLATARKTYERIITERVRRQRWIVLSKMLPSPLSLWAQRKGSR